MCFQSVLQQEAKNKQIHFCVWVIRHEDKCLTTLALRAVTKTREAKILNNCGLQMSSQQGWDTPNSTEQMSIATSNQSFLKGYFITTHCICLFFCQCFLLVSSLEPYFFFITNANHINYILHTMLYWNAFCSFQFGCRIQWSTKHCKKHCIYRCPSFALTVSTPVLLAQIANVIS